MDLYEGCAKLFDYLSLNGWSEDAAAGFVDGILHDNRTRVARESALAWACRDRDCLEIIGGAQRPMPPAQAVQPLQPGRYVRIGKDATVWVSR